MDEKEILKKIKIVACDVLNEVVRVCDENDIKYFLGYGTLLGAVRHKGFIPWDDDVDIYMFRDDYERFASIASEKLGSNYIFQDWRNEIEYPFAMGKVRMNGTLSKENSFNHLNMHQGIFIDIFPLDKFPEDIKETQKIRKKCIALNNFSVLLSLDPKRKRNPLRNIVIYIAKKLFNGKKIQKKLYDYIMHNNKSEYEYYGLHTDNPFEHYRMEDFCPAVKLEFEGKFYDCPKNYHKILQNTYGDYMQLPPEDQRVHHFRDVDFGNFFDKQ